MADKLGDKIGPRLAALWVQSHLAVRKTTVPLDAHIHQTATQNIIDRAGREVADLWRPIIQPLLDGEHGPVHPEMAAYLTKATSGKHQWQSMAGVLGGLAQSALSQAISNAVAPITYAINSTGPNLNADASVWAAGVTAGYADFPTGQSVAHQQGLGGGNFQMMCDLAQNIPGAAQLLDMVNRGLISEHEATNYLHNAAVPMPLIPPLVQTRLQLLSPADIALGLLRGDLNQAEAEARAAKAGVSADDLAVITYNTGEPPAIEQMLMLWVRGQISESEFDTAIRQSRVRNQWIPAIKALRVQPPTQEEVLQALVQGEVSEQEARVRFAQAFGDPAWFQSAWQTRANAPSPLQAIEMALRGIIPWDGLGPERVSFAQAFREGRWKDKYQEAFRQLAVYLPPPREVATLVKEAALPEAEAERLWEQHGLTPGLAHTYWIAAHYQKTSAVHELAQGEITRLYFDQAISRDQAVKMLEEINWNKTDSEFLLDITDLKRERAAVESAIKKVSALYVAYKIDAGEARKALADLGVISSQVEYLVGVWTLERAEAVKLLTPSEIALAAVYGIVTPDVSMGMLVNLGYSPFDAWVLINVENKGPILGFEAPA